MLQSDFAFRVPCVSNEQGFWIGKASLRQWRQLALEQLEEEEEEMKHSDCKTNGENSTGAKGERGRSHALRSETNKSHCFTWDSGPKCSKVVRAHFT